MKTTQQNEGRVPICPVAVYGTTERKEKIMFHITLFLDLGQLFECQLKSIKYEMQIPLIVLY